MWKSAGASLHFTLKKRPVTSYRHSAPQHNTVPLTCVSRARQLLVCPDISRQHRRWRTLTLLRTRRLVLSHIAAGSSRGQSGAQCAPGPVPGSPAHFSNSVWETVRDLIQVSMRRPPGWSDLTGCTLLQMSAACDSPPSPCTTRRHLHVFHWALPGLH